MVFFTSKREIWLLLAPILIAGALFELGQIWIKGKTSLVAKKASSSDEHHKHAFGDGAEHHVHHGKHHGHSESMMHHSSHQHYIHNDNDASFCNPGMPMSMFMDGFHVSSLFFRQNSQPSSSSSPSAINNSREKEEMPNCLVYFVEFWQLTDMTKFRIAMVISFALGFACEALSAVRGRVVSNNSLLLLKESPPQRQHAILSILYGIQAAAGYLIMFVAMTYSIELLMSVVVGLAVGHAWFFGRSLVVLDKDNIPNDGIDNNNTKARRDHPGRPSSGDKHDSEESSLATNSATYHDSDSTIRSSQLRQRPPVAPSGECCQSK